MTNKNFIKSIVLLLIVAIGISSCKGTKEVVHDANHSTVVEKNEKLENALLWEITGNGLKTPSYLFGTIHIIESEDYFLPKRTLSAIDQAEEMVFEIDMNEMADMSDMSKAMGMLQDIFMPDNKTLKDIMSSEDYSIVETHFKKIGLPIFMFERIKPMFLTVLASTDMDPTGLQNGSMKSYEFEFFEIANKTNKKVSGLETIAFQMGIFDKIPYEDQGKMLVESIKNDDVGGAEFAEMIKIYKEQNIEAMVSMISTDEEGIGNYEDILVGERNKNWIPLMEKKMKLMSVFYAVGAGHLAGKNGVINLLKKRGYNLKPLSQVES